MASCPQPRGQHLFRKHTDYTIPNHKLARTRGCCMASPQQVCSHCFRCFSCSSARSPCRSPRTHNVGTTKCQCRSLLLACGLITLEPFTVSLSVYWDLRLPPLRTYRGSPQVRFPNPSIVPLQPSQCSDSPAAKSFYPSSSVEINGPGLVNIFCETILCARCLDDKGAALAIHSVHRSPAASVAISTTH